MNTNSSHDSFDEPSVDQLFELQDLAPSDFASRTVATLRARQHRARVYRLAAISSAAAAIALAFILATLRPVPGTTAPIASGADVSPQNTEIAHSVATAPTPSPTDLSVNRSPTADELTEALYATFSEDEVMFYGHASELEDLLAEAVALSDEENLQTLDMLLVLAQN